MNRLTNESSFHLRLRADLLPLFLIFAVSARSADLTGKVTAADGAPVSMALVHIVSGPAQTTPAAPPPPKTLTIRGGRLDPQLFITYVGEPFMIVNTDADNYNFHISLAHNERNIACRAGTQVSIVAQKPELFARAWEDLGRLRGSVCVLERGPYAVTDEHGLFTLADVPAGKYTIQAAHGRHGTLRREISITDAPATLDFQLSPRAQAQQ